MSGEVGPADLGGDRMRLHGDVADARCGPAALHREVADVGAELEHRPRAPAERPPPRQQLGLPALLAAPVELLEHLRVDGDELEVRVVDQAEGDTARGIPPRYSRRSTARRSRRRDVPAPGARARRRASATGTGIGADDARGRAVVRPDSQGRRVAAEGDR